MATTEPACEPISAEATAMDTENPSSASRPSIKCSLPSILVGSLSYIVVIATCLLGVWFGSVQPFVRRTGGKLKDDNSFVFAEVVPSCHLWMDAFLLIGFALLHSVFVRLYCFERFAGSLARSLQNLCTCAYILVACLYWHSTPPLFNLSDCKWVVMTFGILHLISWIGTLLSLLSFDHLELLGLPQALCDEFPLDRKSNELVKLFRNMRHPLLTYPCILIWAVPRMTYDRLLIGIFVPLYTVWGSALDGEDWKYVKQQFWRKWNFLWGLKED